MIHPSTITLPTLTYPRLPDRGWGDVRVGNVIGRWGGVSLLTIDKVIGKEKTYVGVGVMRVRDEPLKLRDLCVSHKLGCSGNWDT